MKKSLFILAAASVVGFAACNGSNSEGKLTPEQAKAQADSISKIRLDSAQSAMKIQTDSAINAKANADAKTADSLRVMDSMAAEIKKAQTTSVKTVVHHKSGGNGKGTTSTTTTTMAPPPPPATIGTGKPKMGENSNTNNSNSNGTVGSGKPKF
jgi:hypothetical protein